MPAPERAATPSPAPAIAVAAAAAPLATPAQVTAHAPAQAPAQAAIETQTPVRIDPYRLPMADLQGLASQAGLEWVNSDSDKIAAVHAAMAAEPRPIHVPREPRPAVLIDEGPLVLVETRKDLSQMTLPFEQRA